MCGGFKTMVPCGVCTFECKPYKCICAGNAHEIYSINKCNKRKDCDQDVSFGVQSFSKLLKAL